jgi:two-component system NarL family sensor kinase
MQIPSNQLFFLIIIASVIFLIAPISLIIYVVLYNARKKRHHEEKEWLKTNFENELLKSQMEVQEQTMQNIASNLHDNVGQLLSLTVVTLSTANTNDPARTAQKIEAAKELAKRGIKELRQLSRLIYGQELLKGGLAGAVGFELDYLKAAEIYTVNFNSSYQTKEGQYDREIILFRIFQEILNNTVRHADATIITVALEQPEGSLRLSIKDNGKGFNEAETLKEKKGMGLFNIRKRVALIGGAMTITSSPGMGAEFNIEIPYK